MHLNDIADNLSLRNATTLPTISSSPQTIISFIVSWIIFITIVLFIMCEIGTSIIFMMMSAVIVWMTIMLINNGEEVRVVKL